MLNNGISDEQKEMCATLVLRTMLEDYSQEQKRTFQDLFLEFAKSKTYSLLYDYSSGLWKEGPDYLKNIYLDELDRRK